MANKNNGGVYANMDFPPYAYQEYPKHIKTGPHGQYAIVNSAAEEAQILNKLQVDEDNAPAELVQLVSDPEKEILISRAKELGVPFNAKWSKSKLQMVVNEAEEAVDVLPPEDPEAKEKEKNVPQPVEGETPEEYKDHLIQEAKFLGIPANKLWGLPRLKASISEAKAKLKD